MSNSVVQYTTESRIRAGGWAALINKLKRIGVLTDALVAASTSVQDLIDDINAALVVSGTSTAKYGPHVAALVAFLLAEIRFMESVGLIDDTIVGNLTTVNTASAATDLRYLGASKVTDPDYDAADESYVGDAVFGAVNYAT